MGGVTGGTAGSAAPRLVRDSGGRELTVRELTALDRLRLFKAVGPALSQNTAYLGMAILAVSVTSIDGVPVPAPVTEGQLESLIGKLGDVGMVAVADALDQVAAPEMDVVTAGN